ncbi:MAG: PGAP1-like alpha/beta domain-containing protein [Marmoricola sp.]
MSGDGLTVTGGANGLAARFDDLHAHANLLDTIASDLGEVAATLARVAISPDIAEAAVLCPIEAARTEEALLAANVGPHGVGVAWARAEASVAFVRFSIAAYQEVDDLLDRAGDQLAFAGGFAAGRLGTPLLAAAALSNPLVAAALWVNRGRLLDGAQKLAYEEPWVQEIATRSAPGFVEGAASSILGGSPVLMALVSGGHWPTSDLRGAVDGLLQIAGRAGLLQDSGRLEVKRVGSPSSTDLREGRFFAEVMRQQDLLDDKDRTIQVIAVDGPRGPSYVVQIPGTQEWAPTRGGNPVDLATNVHLVAGHQTQLAAAVITAMRESNIPRDAPVMLTGHSQGGLAAATMAANPQCRAEFNIAAVVTAGSPIARVPIPSDVAVFSIEGRRDLVPKLDGADNPDRPNWVTVTRDDDGSVDGDGEDVVDAHSVRTYRRTASAIDGADEPALLRWRADNTDFFGHGSISQFRLSVAGTR